MSIPSENTFIAIQQIVWAEPALQAQLFELIEADEFFRAVDAIAKARGLSVDENTLAAVMRENVQAWHERLLA